MRVNWDDQPRGLGVGRGDHGHFSAWAAWSCLGSGKKYSINISFTPTWHTRIHKQFIYSWHSSITAMDAFNKAKDSPLTFSSLPILKDTLLARLARELGSKRSETQSHHQWAGPSVSGTGTGISFLGSSLEFDGNSLGNEDINNR